MFSERYIFYSILVILFDRVTSLKPPTCDQSKKTLGEGNIRQTSIFPWLGVLRVHYHDGDSFKIGITGLVLIKTKYCIANAYDVAKISKNYIKKEGKAMFIVKDNETWSCGVRDYMTHPEYEVASHHTIALLELDDVHNDGLVPICLADANYNTANQLYAVGYTDEHMLLEKVLYKIQYVNHQLCDEFYSRIGFNKFQETLTRYYCGFAMNNKENCEWENGMVLASNASGPWVLVGLGIKGPGCAAPSRFIDVLSYLPWIRALSEEIYF